jgi:hypothetical protein
VGQTLQNWGQYLEAAPVTWNGSKTDPKVSWCNTSDFLTSNVTDPELKKLIGVGIGKGKGNTQLMTAYCKSGAANLATAYRGGGKSDWFLPSRDELHQLHLYNEYIGDVARASYWSSSEFDAKYAWHAFIYFGYAPTANYLKFNAFNVRPVRSF